MTTHTPLSPAPEASARYPTHGGKLIGLAAATGLLAVVCVSYVLQQTLVVPALPTIQRDLGTTTAWATWASSSSSPRVP